MKELETHPFPPFADSGTRLLVMGTFPPQPKRWSMNFYYPNRTNDFWYMMGLIFMGDRYALFDRETKTFRLDDIKKLLREKGIGLSDTGYRIRRLRDNASDKYLDIVEPVSLQPLLDRCPLLKTLCTTGEKAAQVLAGLTGTEMLRMGAKTVSASGLTIWRMPSTSRAYPLSLEKKAACYARMFKDCGILDG